MYYNKWGVRDATLILQNIVRNNLRGTDTPYPKIGMFCALSQNYQHLFEI